MHMSGETSTYNVMELCKHDTSYLNLLLQILGQLKYSNFDSQQNSQNFMNRIYSIIWGYYHLFRILCYK
jgi:hypothetical protein